MKDQTADLLIIKIKPALEDKPGTLLSLILVLHLPIRSSISWKWAESKADTRAQTTQGAGLRQNSANRCSYFIALIEKLVTDYNIPLSYDGLQKLFSR